MNPHFISDQKNGHPSPKSTNPQILLQKFPFSSPPFSHRPPMAHPTTHLRILAPDSPPHKAPSMTNHPTPPKLDSAMAAALSSQRPKNSNPPPAIFDSHLQAKALTVSAMVDSSKFRLVKSKSHPRKIASGGGEKLSKLCKELGAQKLFDEKKEANEGVDGGSGLSLVVKDKELKEFQKGRHLGNLRPKMSLLRRGGRRRSFGGSQVELADIFANNGVRVVSVDMPPVMQIHAVDCARKAHDSMEKFTSKTLALSLKREFDGVYGPAWHCIVGTSFGSFVTHSVGGFLYFSMDQKLYILLFKTSVQRAD